MTVGIVNWLLSAPLSATVSIIVFRHGNFVWGCKDKQKGAQNKENAEVANVNLSKQRATNNSYSAIFRNFVP
jgi:hypothetical protein